MTGAWRRTDADFLSGGQRCAAWLYLPDAPGLHPAVVMAHGFAAERTFRLPAVAERFASRGLAVLLFDYRHFGDSEGKPRHLLSHRRQLADWRAAVEHVRGLPQIDPQRIGLWGTSLSGGHVLITAATAPGIKAVVAQTPMVDVPASVSRYGLKYFFQALGHGWWDGLRAVAGLSRHYIPVVAKPGRFAALNQPGSEEGYLRIIPPDSKWQNRCTAWTLTRLTEYRPLGFAPRIACPTLLVVATQDQLIRERTVRKAAERIAHAELITVEADHFAVYQGELFEQLGGLEGDFLSRHLAG